MVSVSFTELTMPSDSLALPEDDFADAQFDRDVGTPPRTLLLILSTPRSGSTLACNLLHQAGVCTAHEYFQPYQIRPAMMRRWGLTEEDDGGIARLWRATAPPPTGFSVSTSTCII